MADEPIGQEGSDDRSALLRERAVETDDDRRLHVDPSERLDDAVRHLGALRDAAEDVHQDRPHVLVGVDDLERGGHHVGARTTADVEEVRGTAADLVDDVECAHRQPRAVGDDADLTFESDVLQALLPRELLALVELDGRRVLVPLGMAERRVVVEADLGVERVHRDRRA